MVRILAVSDEERFYDKSDIDAISDGVDILVSCGDLSPRYLEYIIHKSMPYHSIMVHGNHDKDYFRFDHEHRDEGYSDIYKGMYVINQGTYTVSDRDNVTDRDNEDNSQDSSDGLVIWGFSGACAYGKRPFFFEEKDAASFVRSMKLKNLLWKSKPPVIMLSHCPPAIGGLFEYISYFHRPSESLAEIYHAFSPRLWFYGHIHPRYTTQKLDFRIESDTGSMYLLNAVPYKLVDLDLSSGEIDIFPKKHKYF